MFIRHIYQLTIVLNIVLNVPKIFECRRKNINYNKYKLVIKQICGQIVTCVNIPHHFTVKSNIVSAYRSVK